MVDYYALAGFHCDAVEDRSLEEADAEPRPASRFDAKPYAVAPRKPTTKPLEIARTGDAGRSDTRRA